jgi:hypothetical protein
MDSQFFAGGDGQRLEVGQAIARGYEMRASALLPRQIPEKVLMKQAFELWVAKAVQVQPCEMDFGRNALPLTLLELRGRKPGMKKTKE